MNVLKIGKHLKAKAKWLNSIAPNVSYVRRRRLWGHQRTQASRAGVLLIVVMLDTSIDALVHHHLAIWHRLHRQLNDLGLFIQTFCQLVHAQITSTKGCGNNLAGGGADLRMVAETMTMNMQSFQALPVTGGCQRVKGQRTSSSSSSSSSIITSCCEDGLLQSSS